LNWEFEQQQIRRKTRRPWEEFEVARVLRALAERRHGKKVGKQGGDGVGTQTQNGAPADSVLGVRRRSTKGGGGKNDFGAVDQKSQTPD